MVVRCEDVWREISNFVDDDIAPELRTAIEEHVRGCTRCAAVLEGTRNVIQLYGDDRMLELPLGFDHRLHRKLESNMAPSRRGFLGWMVAAAAAVLALGGFEVARSSGFPPPLRTEHAQRAKDIPPDMMVVVANDGKTFHVAGCRFIHDKTNLRTVTAEQAMREGYAPCVRCLRMYLTGAAVSQNESADREVASLEKGSLK